MVPAFVRTRLAALFLVGVFLVIGGLLFFEASRITGTDFPETAPYVLCTEGTTVVKRAESRLTVRKSERSDVFAGDEIRTLPHSSATVFWADGTFTRLAERSGLSVNELTSDSGRDSVAVDFSLLEGRAWTRAYRYLTGESFLRARFDDGRKIAAVRGTAFVLDADAETLRTESHAVDVTDSAGKLLATVPEGAAVEFTRLKAVLADVANDAWRRSNLRADAEYSAEYAKKVRDRLLREYSEGGTLAERVRKFFARGTGTPPLAVSFSGNSLVVTVSTGAFADSESRRETLAVLKQAYALSAVFDPDAATVLSKESLRDAILDLTPEGNRASVATEFARHETYDAWSAAAHGADVGRLRDKIREYVGRGADESVLRMLESSRAGSRVDRFNDAVDRVRENVFERLSS